MRRYPLSDQERRDCELFHALLCELPCSTRLAASILLCSECAVNSYRQGRNRVPAKVAARLPQLFEQMRARLDRAEEFSVVLMHRIPPAYPFRARQKRGGAS